MAKFKIEWMEVKTSAKGTKYAKCSVTDEQGKQITDVAIFGTFPNFEQIMTGSEIEAEMTSKEYNGATSYSLNPIQTTTSRKPNMDRVMEKKASMIGEAQSIKAQNIAQAQDRSAWMWAKNNASTLLASRGIGSTTPASEIANMVIDLATKIYNGEPVEPF